MKNCEFLNTKTNLVMYGNVGTGKTFLSIALGVEACKKGIETRFFRTAALVNKLSEAKKSGTLSTFMKQILKAELLICDEWGYVPLDKIGAQLLFEVISECYERKTLIINTNIEFSRWVNVFYDEQMTGAIIDRVLHHCHLLLFPDRRRNLVIPMTKKSKEYRENMLYHFLGDALRLTLDIQAVNQVWGLPCYNEFKTGRY